MVASPQDRNIRRILDMLEVIRDSIRQDREYLNEWVTNLNIRMTQLEGVIDGFTTSSTVALNFYEDDPSRFSEHEVHGGITELVNGVNVQAGSPIYISTKGSGKLLIHIVGGGVQDYGTLTVTGVSVDRNDQSQVVDDTDVITVPSTFTGSSGTRDSATDVNGDAVHEHNDCWLTSKWYRTTAANPQISIAASDGFNTKLYVYHISFEQSNDQPNLLIDTFDANVQTKTVNSSAYFSAHLYTVVKDPDTDMVDVGAVARLAIDKGESYIDRYWRLREGNLDLELNGLTDGYWIDMNHGRPNNPDIQDITCKLWIRVEGEPIVLSYPPAPGLPSQGPGIPPPEQKPAVEG